MDGVEYRRRRKAKFVLTGKRPEEARREVIRGRLALGSRDRALFELAISAPTRQ